MTVKHTSLACCLCTGPHVIMNCLPSDFGLAAGSLEALVKADQKDMLGRCVSADRLVVPDIKSRLHANFRIKTNDLDVLQAGKPFTPRGAETKTRAGNDRLLLCTLIDRVQMERSLSADRGHFGRNPV